MEVERGRTTSGEVKEDFLIRRSICIEDTDERDYSDENRCRQISHKFL